MRTPTRVLVAAFVAAATLFAGSAVTAAAAERPSAPDSVSPQAIGVNVLIGNRHSGKCLEILNYSTANFARAAQWTCHGGQNQRWHW